MIDNNTRNEEVIPIKVYRMFSCLSSTSKAAAEKESRLFLIIVFCVLGRLVLELEESRLKCLVLVLLEVCTNEIFTLDVLVSSQRQ